MSFATQLQTSARPDRKPATFTAANVREIVGRLGLELPAVRVRAVVQLIETTHGGDFGAALIWSGGNADQQLARDCRAIYAGLYTDLDLIVWNLEQEAKLAPSFERQQVAIERLARIAARVSASQDRVAA